MSLEVFYYFSQFSISGLRKRNTGKIRRRWLKAKKLKSFHDRESWSFFTKLEG
jgi:hypothetical protein